MFSLLGILFVHVIFHECGDVVKMSTFICQICLRTDIGRPPKIDEKLAEFHDEICEFDVIPNPIVKFCVICAQLLKKFYNFQNKCRKAHKILKKKLRSNRVPLDLHLLLPQTLGYVTPNDKHAVVYMSSDDNENAKQPTNTIIIEPLEIKNEFYDENENPFFDIKNESVPSELQNDDEIHKIETVTNPLHDLTDDSCCTDSITFSDVDMDDLIKVNNKQNGVDETNDEELNSDDDITDCDLDEPKETLKNGKNPRQPKKNESQFLVELKPLTAFNREQIAYKRKQGQIQSFIDNTVSFLDRGLLDLRGITVTKEMFLEMFENIDKHELILSDSRSICGLFLGDSSSISDPKKIQRFVLRLYNRFDPNLKTVYDIQYLNTREKKLAEFDARKNYTEYITAKHKCELCFRGFELKKLLDFHMKWHEPSRAYVCDICPMRFLTRSAQLSHKAQHVCLYRCKLCPLLTYCQSTVKNHYDQHKGVTYKCDVCLNEYSSHSTLNSHRLAHAVLSCPYCARLCVSSLGLTFHVKSKHAEEVSACPEPQVSCQHCDAKFVSEHVLGIHLKKHASSRLDQNSFKCQYIGCGESFTSPADLQAHALMEGHVRSAKQRTVRLRKDAIKNEKNLGRTYKGYLSKKTCRVCQKEVTMESPQSMYTHHTTYHGKVPYVRSRLQRYLCHECGKTFQHLCEYKSHLVVHKGVKPFACDICGARFFNEGALSMHKKYHGPRQYECNECGKGFTTKTHLHTHMIAHIGDRKFRCDICSKAFLYRGALNDHIKGVHNNIRRVRKTASKM